MTQKQKVLKDLLLKDICCRLPYGVKVLYKENIYRIFDVSISNETITICGEKGYPIEVEIQKVKPYLLPISSMSEEQRKEFDTTLKYLHAEEIDIWTRDTYDWCDKNHFDYRGLIPMGLALDATNLNIY